TRRSSSTSPGSAMRSIASSARAASRASRTSWRWTCRRSARAWPAAPTSSRWSRPATSPSRAGSTRPIRSRSSAASGVAIAPRYHPNVAQPAVAEPVTRVGARAPHVLLAAATALALFGVAVLPFLTPAYVRLEQDRTGVAALTGFDSATLDAVTASILGDLLLGGDFTVAVDGVPVLTERERGHMRDVRGVFQGFGLLVAASLAILAVGFRRGRGTEARAAAWRAAGGGARALAVGLVVVGAFAVL